MNMYAINNMKPRSKSKYSIDALIDIFFESHIHIKHIDKQDLYNAIDEKDIGTVVSLVTSRSTLNSSKSDPYKDLALHVAILMGQVKTIELLLNQGARANSSFKNEITSLHLICSRRYTPALLKDDRLTVLKLLLKHGANINAIEKEYGDSPLITATHSGLFFMIKILLDNGADKYYCNNAHHSAFSTAIFKKANITFLELLYNENIDLNQMINSGFTILSHTVKWTDYSHLIVFLLKHGIPIERFIVIGNQCNLLHLCYLYNMPTIKIFLNYGVDVNAKNLKGETPLHVFILNKPLNYVKLLIKYGADINSLNNSNQSALHISARHIRIEFLEFFLNLNIDVNCKDNLNCTPLFYAVNYNLYKHVKLLLEHQADVNQRNINGDTPLHIAAKLNCLHLVNILLSHNSDINIENTFGMTPLKLSHQFGIESTVYTELVKHAAIKYFTNNLSNKNLKFLHSVSKELFENCLAELQHMKTTKILEDITYFDILVKSTNKLLFYVNNKSFLLKFRHNLQFYNNYLDVLKSNVETAKDRLKLTRESESSLLRAVQNVNKTWGNVQLPNLIVKHILSYLYIKDLKNLSSLYRHS